MYKNLNTVIREMMRDAKRAIDVEDKQEQIEDMTDEERSLNKRERQLKIIDNP